MKKKALCVIFGTALAGAISVASAEEPLTLNANQMDRVTAGGFGFVDVELIVTKFKDVQENVLKDVNKNITTTVDVDDFLADAEAGANCLGLDCVSETLTITDVRADLLTATSFSESLSAGTAFTDGVTAPAPAPTP